jgi:hypothetical protein
MLAACDPPSIGAVVEAAGITPDAVIRLEAGLAVAARALDGTVAVLRLSDTDDGWDWSVIASGNGGGAAGTVKAFGYDGDVQSFVDAWDRVIDSGVGLRDPG